MNPAHKFIHNLWILVQLEAPAPMQRTVVPRLREAKGVAQLLAKPYLPVYQLRGRGRCGDPLSVSYVGMDYSQALLASLLFVETPAKRKVGQIPFWRCHKVATWSSDDMVIVDAVKSLVHKLPRQNAVVLPSHVDHILDVGGSWQDLCRRFHSTVRRHELRWIDKYGYEYDISHDDGDFDTLYHEMYLPTMEKRLGALFSPMSIEEARQYFRHGWLFRIKRDGEWVSGVLCHLQHDTLIPQIAGVKRADIRLMHEGAMSMVYYAVIHWANQHQCKAVNFLGTGPYLSIGLFQQKRKWGTTVSIPLGLQQRLWLGIRRLTPAVSHFLKANPLIVIGEDGNLHGQIVVDDLFDVTDETKAVWKTRYATPGLSSLVVRSAHSFAEKSEGSGSPQFVIPMPAGMTAQAQDDVLSMAR